MRMNVRDNERSNQDSLMLSAIWSTYECINLEMIEFGAKKHLLRCAAAGFMLNLGSLMIAFFTRPRC